MFSGNIHCKQIIVAASGDKGYAGILRKYAPITGISDNITLIEARPFPPQFEQVAKSFRCERLPAIFRTQDLGSSMFQGGQAHHERQSDSSDGKHDNTFSHSPTSTSSSPVQPTESKSSGHSGSAKIYFNKSGHRLDPKIQYHKQLFGPLQQRKLCLSFYLATCNYPACKYDHKSSLTSNELTTLRYTARVNPCRTSNCQNAACFYGYVCPYDGTCNLGDSCKFPAHMHRVDAKVDDSRTLTASD